MNKKINFKILILAVALISSMVFINFTGCSKNKVDNDFNVTELKCNTGKKLDDTDMQEIENIIKEAVGDKFIKLEKRDGIVSVYGIPTLPADENTQEGEEAEYDIGDSVYILCHLLEEEKSLAIFTAIADKFGFIHDYGDEFEKNAYMISYTPLYMPE